MDPFSIDSCKLTAFILSHLKPVLVPRSESNKGCMSALRCCPAAERLPQELLDLIATYVSISCVDLPPERDGLLPGSWWKEELIKGKLLPWLYDLDEDMIDKKDHALPEIQFGASEMWGEWDWEGLVRKLSRTHFYKDLTIHRWGDKEELASKNRRRTFLVMDDLCNFHPGQQRRDRDIDWSDRDCHCHTLARRGFAGGVHSTL